MRRHLLSALLFLTACSTNGGTSTPPTPAAPPKAEVDSAETGAGFADPKLADEAPKDGAPGPAASPELAARIKKQFGERCRHERACGDLIGVDCESAVDGPYYYVKRDTLEVVSRCGGACRMGCTDCPPKAWTCPTY